MKANKFSKLLIFPLKILFSRFTFAIISLLIQILFLAFLYFFFQRYILVFLGGIRFFSFILVISIMNQSKNSEFKTSWIIFILCLPTVGCLFYLFCQLEPTLNTLKMRLKMRKNKNKVYLPQQEDILEELKDDNFKIYQHALYMNKVGHFPVYHASDVTYFKIGEEFYQDFLEKIRNAKKFIFLEFFIVADDEMWNKILDILKEKVKENVEVRLLYDGMCSVFLLKKNYPQILSTYGIKCKQFSPIVPLISTHYNNRDHRKIIVIDGEFSYTGGCNLANEYINQNSKYGHWKDNMLRFSGLSVNSLTVLFLEMWNLNDVKDKENYEDFLVSCEKNVDMGYILPFGDDPFDDEQIGKLTYMTLLNNAKEKIDIVTPYFIVDREFLNTLYYVSKKGVKIRLVLPGIADKKIVNFIAKAQYKELLDNKIEVYEYTPGFTHLKVMLEDDDTCVMGTINLDYRSLYLHFEDGVLLYQVDEIKKIQKDYDSIISKSKKITMKELKKMSKFQLFLGKIFRIFGPLL